MYYMQYIYLYLCTIYNTFMPRKSSSKLMTRKLSSHLKILGEQIHLARLRRKLSMELVAERAQCTRLTVSRLENGDPAVSIGTLLRVLNALQLENDIILVAKDDEMGRLLQDLELKNK